MKEVATHFADGLDGTEFGIFVGRLCPMHKGHQAMIESLIEVFDNRHIVLIGSCNNPISIKYLFSYSERSEFVRAVFANARVAPLPDFGHTATWFAALDDIIRLAGGDPAKAVYIGGSKEDVEFYYEHGRNVRIVNRFSGVTINISGQQIRDALIERRTDDLEKYIDPRVVPILQERFRTRWQEVRNK